MGCQGQKRELGVLSIVGDLHTFLVHPRGSETLGAAWTALRCILVKGTQGGNGERHIFIYCYS
jgi:hypothetical protein